MAMEPGLKRLERGVGEAKSNIQEWFSKRGERGKLSKVHDWGHVYAVARHAKIVAEELAKKEGFNAGEAQRIGLLAEGAGYLHDIVRRARESKPHGAQGERAIKMLFERAAKKAGGIGVETPFSAEEKKIMGQAVGLHESNWKQLEENTANLAPEARIVAQAVFAGDKIFEASGHRVLERRSFFVGKERMEKPELAPLKARYGEKAPLFAVAMESAMRLRSINVVDDMPDWARPIARPLHKVQEEFYYALLNHLGLGEKELLTEMKRVNFPKFEGKTEAQVRANVARADSDRFVRAAGRDAAASAAELVNHIANSKSPDEAIATFNPKGEAAKAWLEGIRQYKQGSEDYLERVRGQMRKYLK